MPSERKKSSHIMPNITGVWTCNDGGKYYIRQLGRRVFCAGLGSNDQGSTFTNVYHAIRRRNTIHGQWADVPRGSSFSNGSLTLRISRGTDGVLRLIQLAQTGGFSGTEWRLEKTQELIKKSSENTSLENK
jgi:hypothetical protein